VAIQRRGGKNLGRTPGWCPNTPHNRENGAKCSYHEVTDINGTVLTLDDALGKAVTTSIVTVILTITVLRSEYRLKAGYILVTLPWEAIF
jgi:hypothetical protein